MLTQEEIETLLKNANVPLPPVPPPIQREVYQPSPVPREEQLEALGWASPDEVARLNATIDSYRARMKEMTEEAERKDETVKIASGPIGAFLAGVLTGASIVLTAYQIFKEKVNGKVS